MDDPRRVGGLERVAQIADQLACPLGREHPIADQQSFESNSRNVLEDEAGSDGIIDGRLKKLDRVRMAELSHRLDFGFEQLPELRMGYDVAVDALDDHGRSVANRLREEDVGVAALAEQPDEPVFTQRSLSEHPILHVRRAARPGSYARVGLFSASGNSSWRDETPADSTESHGFPEESSLGDV